MNSMDWNMDWHMDSCFQASRYGSKPGLGRVILQQPLIHFQVPAELAFLPQHRSAGIIHGGGGGTYVVIVAHHAFMYTHAIYIACVKQLAVTLANRFKQNTGSDSEKVTDINSRDNRKAMSIEYRPESKEQ